MTKGTDTITDVKTSSSDHRPALEVNS